MALISTYIHLITLVNRAVVQQKTAYGHGRNERTISLEITARHRKIDRAEFYRFGPSSKDYGATLLEVMVLV